MAIPLVTLGLHTPSLRERPLEDSMTAVSFDATPASLARMVEDSLEPFYPRAGRHLILTSMPPEILLYIRSCSQHCVASAPCADVSSPSVLS